MIEQNIGIASFRPVMRIPKILPIIGFLSSTYMMFYIDFIKSLFALAAIAALYIYLLRRELVAPWGDVRQGLFRAVVEWAARKIQNLPQTGKSWKPDILVPVEKLTIHQTHLELIHDIAFPGGSVHLLHVTCNKTKTVEQKMDKLLEFFDDTELYRDGLIMESDQFNKITPVVLDAMSSSVISPNSVFVSIDKHTIRGARLQKFMEVAVDKKFGVLLFAYDNKVHCGYKRDINLWLRERSPDWDIDKSPNWNLAILTALRLYNSWNGRITICMVINKEKERPIAKQFLEDLITRARLPLDTQIRILHGEFIESLKNAPVADINIFGIGRICDLTQLRKLFNVTGTSCLFIRDAGFENVLE